MNILICEDERPAQKQISKLIKNNRKDAHIVATVETGEEAISVIEQHELDLIFMDVELADGPCFETLDKVEITTPIIFTTAYDEYALKAFQLKSIDYLVKPISQEDIDRAFEKFDDIKKMFEDDLRFVFSKQILQNQTYKERFLIKFGRRLLPIDISEIAYFMAKNKLVFLVTNEQKKYSINFSLAELETMVDPKYFFRINRQYLAHINSIKELEPYFKGQVVVKLIPSSDDNIIVSRDKTPELKEWLGV